MPEMCVISSRAPFLLCLTDEGGGERGITDGERKRRRERER